MRDLVKKTMNEAHDNYVRQILNLEDEENTKPNLGKKFWKYIKSRKKDTMGISPLQNNFGEHIIDSKGKSEILNTQYDSVFTTEDTKNMPNMGTRETISSKSTLRLFADDSLLYRSIKGSEDSLQLQQDLTELTKWAERWQMTFHPAKCYTLRVSRKKNPTIKEYEMMGQQQSTVHQYPYLGVELSEDLSWDPHIKKVITKSNRVLGFSDATSGSVYKTSKRRPIHR
ncbi:unnamed protein product [Mytilus coruscus]|uniref:Reverse transcriptase domain-containing protein n=1 Tax=Mytilus coruscus TaxID=42192 RepID=A0A6J8C3C9_MYTCO|nr:unnamed protein product [Mytilus coruscus]